MMLVTRSGQCYGIWYCKINSVLRCGPILAATEEIMELRGKRKICEYTRRAWRTLMALAEKEGFPLAIVGGNWTSDTEEIREWTVKRLRRRGE